MAFAGSSDEDTFVDKVRTKREKRPKTWKLVLRCWCLTSMNHKVLFGDDREISVTIKEDNLEIDNILLQLRSKSALSSRWPLASNHFK